VARAGGFRRGNDRALSSESQLSPTSIADAMREEHGQRVLGE
jgi:hypothetical protein